jgi:hypothetical protein
MRIFLATGVSVLLLLASHVEAADAECPSLPDPYLFEKKGKEIQISWELDHQNDFWRTPLFSLDGIQAYREALSRVLPEGSYFLLQRQERIFKKRFEGDFAKWQQVHEGEVGVIGEMTCLGELLLQKHFRHFPYEEYDSEFGAHIFTKNGQIRVLFSASDKPWVRLTPHLVSQIEDLLDQGWIYEVFLHNHPIHFQLATRPGVKEDHDLGGTILPSGNKDELDVRAFFQWRERWGVREFWITNGLNTARFSSEDMKIMKQWGPIQLKRE